MVREAFDTSVTCNAPPESFHASQLSTVPNASSPRSACSRRPGMLSSSQASLVAEKYGSSTRPVLLRTAGVLPRRFNPAHAAAVRRSCQTIALCTGWPDLRSHTMVVSRWLAMPSAAISAAFSPAWASARRATRNCEPQMSSGSCSTQPGCGKIWRNSCCAVARTLPSSAKTIARELVVP